MQIPDFTLKQLGYLLAVADAGTIAAAARTLHLSPSAVSDALSELDQVLGTPLTVRRRAHGVTLTSTGVVVARQARAIVQAANELAFSLEAPDGDLVGPIVIGCYPTLAPTVLPPLLQDFGAQHPRVDLKILETTHDQLDGKIESGEVDLAFVYDMLLPGTPRREQLFALPAHVLLAADDPLADSATINLQDVVERDLILLDSPPSSEHTLSLFAGQGLSPKIRHRASSYEAVRTLVGRGLGYGILVQRPANNTSYEGYPLVMKEISPAVPPVSIDVIWSDTVDPPERVRALIGFARSISWFGSR